MVEFLLVVRRQQLPFFQAFLMTLKVHIVNVTTLCDDSLVSLHNYIFFFS